MGLMQRRKGRAFEQLIATALRKRFPKERVRRSLQAHRPYEPDVVVEGVPVWWECQHANAPNPKAKMRQAFRDMKKAQDKGRDYRVAVVVWRKSSERTVRASVRLADLFRFTGGGGMPMVLPQLVTMDFADLLSLSRIDLLHEEWPPE